jgi:hypothetical protein
VTLVNVTLILKYESLTKERKQEQLRISKDSAIKDWAINTATLEDAINSATGTLFSGQRIRMFDDERFFTNFMNTPRSTHQKESASDVMMCEKWNVVTTIFAPSPAVIRAAKVAGWCTVIVADTKTPHDYMERAGLVGMKSMVHYLSVDDQQKWLEGEKKSNGSISTAVGKFLAAIPYKHFARKNIGYMYAIQHGAKLLFDFDDDNLLPIDPSTGEVFPPLTNETFLTEARMVVNGPNVFNHHTLMGATVQNSWARGFPLQFIQDNTTQGDVVFDDHELDLMESVGVLQFCANGNPDIDAIHRLVHPLPMTFESYTSPELEVGYSPVSTKGSLVVPSHSFEPLLVDGAVALPTTFAELLRSMPDVYNGVYHGYLAEYSDAQKTAAELLRLTTAEFPSDQVPAVFAFQDNNRRIRTVHHIHKVTRPLGQAPGAWDNVYIGFISNVHEGHITSVVLPVQELFAAVQAV